jgi:CheY-like chemotaxis protein
MNGVTLSKNLKQTPYCAETPILFMTTQGKASVENLPEFSLFDGVINKPLNEAELLTAVTALIKDSTSKIAL